MKKSPVTKVVSGITVNGINVTSKNVRRILDNAVKVLRSQLDRPTDECWCCNTKFTFLELEKHVYNGHR